MNCSTHSASSASCQTLDVACCLTPGSQPAPHLSDRTLLCYLVAVPSQKNPHRKNCSAPHLSDRTVLPCSHSHSEEPSQEELFLPSKPTSKSLLTYRRARHSPGVSLPSSKAGKGSLLPSVKLTRPTWKLQPPHGCLCPVDLALPWTLLRMLVSVAHPPQETPFPLADTYNHPIPVFKSSPPAGFPGHSSERVPSTMRLSPLSQFSQLLHRAAVSLSTDITS